MFRLNDEGRFEPMEMTGAALAAIRAISETCQPSLVSALYVGGAGDRPEPG